MDNLLDVLKNVTPEEWAAVKKDLDARSTFIETPFGTIQLVTSQFVAKDEAVVMSRFTPTKIII